MIHHASKETALVDIRKIAGLEIIATDKNRRKWGGRDMCGHFEIEVPADFGFK